MHDAGLLYVGVCLLHIALQCGADFGFTFIDGAHRQLNSEQIGQHPLHLQLAQVESGGGFPLSQEGPVKFPQSFINVLFASARLHIVPRYLV